MTSPASAVNMKSSKIEIEIKTKPKVQEIITSRNESSQEIRKKLVGVY
jgi:hypothetical protein